MNSSLSLYGSSLGLLTDLYQLTMAYGYWKLGMADREAVFHVSFRKAPFDGGFTVACGLAAVVDYVESFAYSRDDLEYLATLRGQDGEALFERGFLDYLGELRISCEIDAVPEGTV